MSVFRLKVFFLSLWVILMAGLFVTADARPQKIAEWNIMYIPCRNAPDTGPAMQLLYVEPVIPTAAEAWYDKQVSDSVFTKAIVVDTNSNRLPNNMTEIARFFAICSRVKGA